MKNAQTWISAASVLLGGLVRLLSAAGVFVCMVCVLGCEENPSRKEEPVPAEGKESSLVGSLEKLRSAWDSEKAPEWPIVELLAVLCEKAYLAPEEAEKAFHTLGLEQVRPVTAESMVGYVVWAADVAVVVFRGTDDQADWLVNLDCRTAETPHGTIHKGFYEAYHATPNPQQSLRSQILARLKEGAPKYLWITGHSLGGALALVCAYDLIENEKFPVNGVLTFGQPMVVQPQLGEYLDQLLVRRYTYFVNGKDIVPRVPPTYVHCGARIWFHDGQIERFAPLRSPSRIAPLKGLPQEDALVPMSPEEFEQLKAALRKADRISRGTSLKGNLPWLRDHAIENYRERVHTALDAEASAESDSQMK
ncbi:MAG TPA: lipase family protein [Thermoguttaceae bacterium]|nr:lipase family protein [Thermoguttaceae bacterium]HPP52026.1 lipase family protein [Thermoguttaceae bacterium]